MLTKTEELYTALLSMKVASFDDIVVKARSVIQGDAGRRYIYRKYVDRLIEKGRLQRIRRGLYIVLSPVEEPERRVVDKLLIASKVRDEYYLGFHTALEYYGCAHSAYNEAYICVNVNSRFDAFRYERFMFRPVFVEDTDLEVEEKRWQESILRVSSKERTFLDCIDRVWYSGGWEECLKSLEGLGGLDFEKLVELLHKYEKDILFRRVGYVLELLKKRSPFYEHLNERLLNEIEQQITGSPRYLVSGKKGVLNKRWNLYISRDFEKILRGI